LKNSLSSKALYNLNVVSFFKNILKLLFYVYCILPIVGIARVFLVSIVIQLNLLQV